MSETKPEKRFALVGTAGSWKQCPWDDKTITIAGLNDGYMLGEKRTGQKALPRADLWYDLHAFHEMCFQPAHQARVSALNVPVGAYVRPEGHLDWLKSRPFPVYLQHAPAGWPTAQTFPRKELEVKHGTYFASTPAWMLVHMLEMGATSIEIYGINLATEWEYVNQRPNFEFWLRYAIDRGCKIILPTGCPLLHSKYVYAYEPKPDLPVQVATIQIQRIKAEGAKVQQEMAALGLLARGRKKDLAARLAVLNLELADAQQARQRVQLALA